MTVNFFGSLIEPLPQLYKVLQGEFPILSGAVTHSAPAIFFLALCKISSHI
jgi:hypothetical protein